MYAFASVAKITTGSSRSLKRLLSVAYALSASPLTISLESENIFASVEIITVLSICSLVILPEFTKEQTLSNSFRNVL